MNLSPHEARFERNVELLKQYVAERGHCNIALATTVLAGNDEVKLGRWVGYMRTQHKRQKLDRYRIATLEAIPGWSWETRRSGPQPKQVERNNEIRSLRRQGITLELIAYNYGLSKQRVAQLCEGIKPGS